MRNVLGLIVILFPALVPAPAARSPFVAGTARQATRAACDAFDGAMSDFCPARQQSVALPPGPSPQTVGWIDEKLEATVDARGRVNDVHLLEGAPGGSSLVAPALKSWQFRPAIDQGNPVPSHVLVAAIFRPPLTVNGPTAGTPAVRLARPSPETPFPVAAPLPTYPAQGTVEQALVLVEVLVDPNGSVQTALMVRSAEGVNREALDAARAWSFRPARENGRPVPAYAYLLFGFRRPLAAG